MSECEVSLILQRTARNSANHESRRKCYQKLLGGIPPLDVYRCECLEVNDNTITCKVYHGNGGYTVYMSFGNAKDRDTYLQDAPFTNITWSYLEFSVVYSCISIRFNTEDPYRNKMSEICRSVSVDLKSSLFEKVDPVVKTAEQLKDVDQIGNYCDLVDPCSHSCSLTFTDGSSCTVGMYSYDIGKLLKYLGKLPQDVKIGCIFDYVDYIRSTQE